jgi:hypothetical protein
MTCEQKRQVVINLFPFIYEDASFEELRVMIRCMLNYCPYRS